VAVTAHRPVVDALMLAGLGALAAVSPANFAAPGASPATGEVEEVVITAQRLRPAVSDEKLLVQVKEALHSDPYLFDGHITVTVKDGVVRLQGMVFDYDDIRITKRIIRKTVVGVKRVVNELEICSCDGGGGA
jgi:osmotically-inducible protein OsmY